MSPVNEQSLLVLQTWLPFGAYFYYLLDFDSDKILTIIAEESKVVLMMLLPYTCFSKGQSSPTA